MRDYWEEKNNFNDRHQFSDGGLLNYLTMVLEIPRNEALDFCRSVWQGREKANQTIDKLYKQAKFKKDFNQILED